MGRYLCHSPKASIPSPSWSTCLCQGLYHVISLVFLCQPTLTLHSLLDAAFEEAIPNPGVNHVSVPSWSLLTQSTENITQLLLRA